ncbi:MAG: 2-oxoacid:acceptor oxidoreductase family protein [Firmicutes bacterium]|nr:2-oxoacid:acceptor oxidoreductase family protein [Bacillota bacterium]MDD4336230.1 2-oxoacid:acceptor oxidoreductase family protein [Bacillota bacterium]MDD4791923.1 2-oxoacid:acceptor oxidoreductase family protein [Bacillota bacterium]
MANLLEIRWHGRAGQGAKTAALVLAEAAISTGKYAQAFPEYGPERMGAPMKAYNRISDEPITVHHHVEEPDIVIVLDPTLLTVGDVKAGVPDDGIYLINTPLSASEMRKTLDLEGSGAKVYTLDATQVSMDTIGRNIPNTPMMGALVAATGLLELDELLEDTRIKLSKKLRPEVVDKNMEAIKRAYREVAS